MADSADRLSPSFLKRMSIGTDAVSYQGCHYLWGAAGATPGNQDGARYRAGSVDWVPNQINNPSQAMVWACSCNVDPPTRVCCGRYDEVSGGREARPRDQDLLDYLALLKSTPVQSMWPPFFDRFTPRLANWMEGQSMVSKLVWGEDCRGVRHFDCIGFINFLLMDWNVQLLARSQAGISWLRTNLEDVSDQEPWPADIVMVGTDHIGILFNETRVVHAFQSISGVIMEPFTAGNPGNYGPGNSTRVRWDMRGRVPDALL
jgi:hypothetical protein